MVSQTHRKVVVVTGASAGIGRAVVQRFSRDGADIGLIARGRAGLEGAKRDVEAGGGRGLIQQCDVGDPDQVEAAAQRVEDELGPIDIWINVAMLSVFSPVKDMTAEDYKRVTDVTYLGYVYGTMAALKRMRPRDRGKIVQVGSALAYRGIPLQSAYCGAKHAIQGFTESLRTELFHDGSNVTITMVQMPAVNTPQFGWVKSRLPHKAQPVPPIYQPEVAANAVYWAAHHTRRELDVGTSTVVAIWGNKLFAGIGDRYLARTGIKSQQTDEAEDPGRPNNLWQPVDEVDDHGAHGTFGDRAGDESMQLKINMMRDKLMVGAVAIGAGALALRSLRQ